MLGIAKAIPQRLLTPGATIRLQFVRNRQEVPIYKLSPDPPVTNTTMAPWPETQEERERAAKKYNLIIEDYEPYPELDGFGDYPKLPAIGAYNRDKYEDFDDPVDNRNYGEPFHLFSDMYHWERKDPLEHEKISFKQWPWWKRMITCFGYPAAVVAIYYICEKTNVNINHPWKIRECNGNKPIYAFPPSPSDNHHH